MNNKFYVYEWYDIDTNQVFYVGKGCGKRAYDTKQRNSKFLKYRANHNTDVRIVFSNLTEDEAFLKEKELYSLYSQNLNNILCNLMECGHGGLNQVWTDEMREYWSINNPMKQEEQIIRMQTSNPMKNKETALKSGQGHKKAVMINDVLYDGLVDAAQYYRVSPTAIYGWCKKGVNTYGEKCSYVNPPAKGKNHSKSVILDGITYPSIRAAAQAINENSSSLARYLKLGKTEFKGHSCKYADQQPSQ